MDYETMERLNFFIQATGEAFMPIWKMGLAILIAGIVWYLRLEIEQELDVMRKS